MSDQPRTIYGMTPQERSERARDLMARKRELLEARLVGEFCDFGPVELFRAYRAAQEQYVKWLATDASDEARIPTFVRLQILAGDQK